MVVTTVMVRVRPDCLDDFVKATIANHEASVNEPGNRRFDVLQSKEDTCAFMLYEAYESQAAADAHKQTPHYLAWREAVAGSMSEPRRGIAYVSIRP